MVLLSYPGTRMVHVTPVLSVWNPPEQKTVVGVSFDMLKASVLSALAFAAGTKAAVNLSIGTTGGHQISPIMYGIMFEVRWLFVPPIYADGHKGSVRH
jgi:hypothetical protein